MPLRWDPLLAAALSRELSGVLTGSRTRALLFEPDPRRVLLFLEKKTIAFELHPMAGWVSSLGPVAPLPAARPLRGRIKGVRALHDESAFVLELLLSRGRPGRLDLAIELSGNRWNAALVERPGGTVRQLLRPERGGRRLDVGGRYEPPPSTGRREPRDAAEWREIAGPPEAGAEERRKRLLGSVAWTSSLNAGWLDDPGGWERWTEMIEPERWRGYLLHTPRGPQPYPVPLGDPDAERFPSLLDALAAARERAEEAASPSALLVPWEILKEGERRAHRLRTKAERLARELEATANPEAVRAMGDLILARSAELPRGTERAVLTGFDGQPTEVTLDPSLSPHQNAARRYAEAARVERAREGLPARIRATEAEMARWSELLEGVRVGRIPAEELSRSMRSGAEGDSASARKMAGDGPLPYRRFTSSGGLEIRVGRSARRNDDLTFRHSAPDDLWLHAGQAAGAHVILRWGRGENPPRRDLLEAAVLAALHSEARHSGSVAVTWTRRKHVRKPRKAAPGTVVAERAQTLFVKPDPGLLERLSRGDS